MIGDALVTHPDIAAIRFTGSVGVGKRIGTQAMEHHKKIQLEMGGKNPQVILDDADLVQAVELSAQSAFYSTGQRCTASSCLIVTEGDLLPVHRRTARPDDQNQGWRRLGSWHRHRLVSSQVQLEQDLSYVEIAPAEGAHLLFGGLRIACHTGSGNEGYFMSPTLLAETAPAMRINRKGVLTRSQASSA